MVATNSQSKKDVYMANEEAVKAANDLIDQHGGDLVHATRDLLTKLDAEKSPNPALADTADAMASHLRQNDMDERAKLLERAADKARGLNGVYRRLA